MTRPRLWIALAALVAAVLFLPLRLAAAWVGLDATGLTARQTSGTIWSGRFDQARFGGFDLGTLDAGLHPLPLLLGRARFAFERAQGGGPLPLSGSIEIGPGRRVVEGLSGTVTAVGPQPLPIESVSFDQASVHFSDGQCRSASGRVQLMLAVRIAGIDLRNGLSGEVRCEGRALLVPLAGQSGMERLNLTIEGNGRYQARFGIAATDPVTAAALSAAGFSATSEGWYRTMRGQF